MGCLFCWVGRSTDWFALLVGVRCWLVCVARWFALRFGLHCGLGCVAGGEREGGGEEAAVCDGLGLENENPLTRVVVGQHKKTYTEQR